MYNGSLKGTTTSWLQGCWAWLQHARGCTLTDVVCSWTHEKNKRRDGRCYLSFIFLLLRNLMVTILCPSLIDSSPLHATDHENLNSEFDTRLLHLIHDMPNIVGNEDNMGMSLKWKIIPSTVSDYHHVTTYIYTILYGYCSYIYTPSILYAVVLVTVSGTIWVSKLTCVPTLWVWYVIGTTSVCLRSWHAHHFRMWYWFHAQVHFPPR